MESELHTVCLVKFFVQGYQEANYSFSNNCFSCLKRKLNMSVDCYTIKYSILLDILCIDDPYIARTLKTEINPFVEMM